MPIDPTVPADGTNAQKPQVRANFAATNARIGALPEAYGLYAPGELIAVNDALGGPVPARDVAAPLTAAGKRFGHFTADTMDITASVALTTDLHGGMVLRARNGSGIVLQLEKTSNPATGVQDCFSCTIQRSQASGSVQVSSSSLANQQGETHTRVSAGGMAVLSVDAVANIFYLEGSTEP